MSYAVLAHEHIGGLDDLYAPDQLGSHVTRDSKDLSLRDAVSIATKILTTLAENWYRITVNPPDDDHEFIGWVCESDGGSFMTVEIVDY